MTHSVVVPVYRNEATLPELLRRIAALQLRGGESFEVIFVVDGSPDNSFAYLKLHLAEMPFASQLVNLSRNFGSFAAIRAGMTLATGDFIGMLAADLQQPLSSIPQFFDALEGGADIVVGQRSSRSDPFLSRVASTTFWRLYRFFVQSEIPAGGIDSFACTRQVRDILVSLPEANSTLVGRLVWVGFRRDVVTYPRAARTAGKSGWSFARKLRYAFDTAFAFSDLPITIMIVAGALGVGGALAIGAAVTVAWALGTISVAGYTPLMLVALFSFCTVRYHKDKWNHWGIRLSQAVFGAVSPEFKGWYRKLVSEISYHLKEIGAQHAYMATQATNSRVAWTLEALAYHYGKSEHILRKVIDGRGRA